MSTVWFILVGVLLAGYALLDGFDLGVGILHLFTKKEKAKRAAIAAVGPVWDGNEVWLLAGGGALFAAFPPVYATVFSGFYLALMLLLFALIARAVSLEFRHQVDGPAWRRTWDIAFGLGSLVPALLFGVAFGNVLRGLPVEAGPTLDINLLFLLNPFSLLAGLCAVAAFVMHGAAYLSMKGLEEDAPKNAKIATAAWAVFAALFVVLIVMAYFAAPLLLEGAASKAFFWIFLVLFVAATVYAPVALKAGTFGRAFAATGAMIVSSFGLCAACLYPRLVPSTVDAAYSLTVYNASSTGRTLTTMFVIALIGMPFVIGYTIFIYRVFKGRAPSDGAY